MQEIKIWNDPYEYLTVDNLLPKDRFDKIREKARKRRDEFILAGANVTSGKYCDFVKEDLLPEANNYFDRLKKCRKYKSLKKVNHWTICPPNWKYATHIDASWRIHTMILYIDPDDTYGTVLCKNKSKFVEHHGPAELESEYEVEVEWKPNRLFCHNPGDDTWHYYKSKDQYRMCIQSFFVDPDQIPEFRHDGLRTLDLDQMIDI
tara:strand:- start:1033 stop:1647 length:615 start_codon:yes stop_codon:yes gene_type:complete